MDLSTPSGSYNTLGITSGSDRRDVSEMLEMWAHKETPFLNRISWGPDSGGLSIEWLTEHTGFGYIETSAAVATGGTAIVIASGVGGLSRAEQVKQINVGTVLMAKGVADSGSESADHAWLIVTTIGTSYSLTVAFMASTTASIAASTKLYIVGAFANEGSTPDRDVSRARTLLSNNFGILRKDIKITGSQMATDMHAVANELQHQTKNRLLAMQFERERALFFSRYQARSTTVAGVMKGILELFIDNIASTDFVDSTTTALSETTFNTMVANLKEAQAMPNVVVGGFTQIRKFTSWATDRIRTTADTRVGGQYITQYLTDTGVTLDLLPLSKFPSHLLFILNTDDIKLRAKTGRKLIIEKLGKVGDYEEWQLLSEYTMEHHGFSWGQHGAFMALT